MAELTLTPRALNRALLARQLLLERAPLPIPAALDRLAGIQNQYAPNAYVRLWTSLAGFERESLTAAYADGSVVQGTLMRGTIHTVSAAAYHRFVTAVRRTRQEWARRIRRGDDSARDAVVARVRDALSGRAVRRSELAALLDGVDPTVQATIDTDAELVRLPPSGTWERRRADLYALADDVLGWHEEVSEPDGLAHLVTSYLAGFGPASRRDVADFAGVPIGALSPVLPSLELRRFRDQGGTELLDVPDGILPDPGVPAPVRFLPTWDAALLVHARRTGILPEALRPLIFHTRMPPSYPTFLVDGQVAGTWRFQDGEVQISPLRELTTAERRLVEDEAHRLAAFHA